MISAIVGTVVIKYLKEKEKKSLYASQRLVDFRGKLNVKMDVNNSL